ncbi:MAG TPA: RHS repeat protein, partial [Nannocystis exedens]|nr:RHS repeat protein [Nannocystis exedens]
IDLCYDDKARLVALHQGPRSLGLRWRSQPGAGDRLVAITLPNPEGIGESVMVSYEFDDFGDLRKVTDALGHHQELTYKAHLLTREVFSDGRAFCFDYDGPTAAAKCLSTSGDGGVFARTFTYDPDSRLTTIVDGDGNQTNVQADGRGRVSTITDALGSTWSFEYDEHDRRICERNPLGAETHYSYDSLGRRRRVSYADGATWSFDHQLDGRLIAATNPKGERWRWRYDDLGRMIEAVDPHGAVSRYEVDPASRRAKLFAPTIIGEQTQNEPCEIHIFNNAGDLLQRRCADGSCWTYKYDRRGRCIEITDALGTVQSFVYDRMDRLIRRTIATDKGDQHVHIQRDPIGRVLRVERPESITTASYGPTGSISSISSIERNSTLESEHHFGYDLDGRLLTVCAGSNQHSFERDALGAIVRETTIDGHSIHYRRNACGRILERRDASDERTLYSYDARGRITAIDYADGGRERFTYDLNGALIRALRDEPVTNEITVSKHLNPSEHPPRDLDAHTESTTPLEPSLANTELLSQATHDGRKRLLEQLTPATPNNREHHLVKLTPATPNGRKRHFVKLTPATRSGRKYRPEQLSHDGRKRHFVELRRDPWGRVLGELSSGRHQPAKNRWIAIRCDHLGRTRLLRSDVGITLASTYTNHRDVAPSRVELRAHQQRWAVDISQDRCGRETYRQLPGGLSSRVQRDTQGRPLRQTILRNGGPFGNIFAEPAATLADRHYHWINGTLRVVHQQTNDSPADRPDHSNAPTVAAAIEYDASGRVIRMPGPVGDMQLHWDAAGRLRCVEGGYQGPVYFDYDALGRRIRKTSGPRETTWIWHGDRPLVEEIRDGEILISRRIWIFDPDPHSEP